MNELTKCIYLCKLSSLNIIKNNFKNNELFNGYFAEKLRFLRKYMVRNESGNKNS
jgi:hypothetical protein